MDKSQSVVTEQIAEAARAFQRQRTGHSPKAVTVVLNGEMLVITLHAALTPVELALSRTPEGADQVREFHRQLFASSAEPLRQEIRRITGIAVREAAAEVEPETGAVLQVFTTGDMVQVFQLARSESATSRNGTVSDPDDAE